MAEVDQERIELYCEATVLNVGPNMLVPFFLIFSFAYYHLNESLVSDEFYDKLCRDLLNAVDALEVDHIHMDLIDTAALRAGSGFYIKFDSYPSRARSAATRMSLGLAP